jgi:Ca-activated chloride channel family protein
MRARRTALVALLGLLAVSAFGLNVSLSQIDASRLLLTQRVRLYVSVTDAEGRSVEGLEPEDFQVSESPDGVSFAPVGQIEEFRPRAGATEGVNFLLLLDNSGSMYDTLAGTPTEDPEKMRITQAEQAVRSFLASMTDPRDTVGLATFNTFYRLEIPPIRDKNAVAAALASIQRPRPEQAYTELYWGLTQAVRAFDGLAGRKAIVVLSDGENYPFAEHSGKPSPVLGERIVPYTQPIRDCQEEGISVYAINYSDQKDPNLQAIGLETGGAIFDARNRVALERVYRRIHDQVAGEYLLVYRATMAPADRKYVRVAVSAPGGAQAQATRFYISSTVFGLPLPSLSYLLLVAAALAVALLWLLTRLRLERRRGPAALEVLRTRVGRASTRVLPLSSTKTVIGGGRGADLTIVGSPGVREKHATILYDSKKNTYTVVGSGEVRVNNQPVKTKVLEPGDVIDVGGATIVFDDGEV